NIAVEKQNLKKIAERVINSENPEQYRENAKEIVSTIINDFDNNDILSLLTNYPDHINAANELMEAHPICSETDSKDGEIIFCKTVISDIVESVYKFEEFKKIVVCLNESGFNTVLLRIALETRAGVYTIINDSSTQEKNNNTSQYNPIKDQNQAYCDNFRTPFFLESEMYDGSLASLQHVYVHPQIKDSPQTIQEVLKEWCDANDPSSTQEADQKRVFLLYGKAGIGKSSLTAYIITHKDEFFPDRPVHAIALRNHVQTISNRDSNQSAWDKVKACFQCTENSNYQNCVLILDGLDEVCVLAPDFQGAEFLQFLCNSCPDNVKILITSRDGNYFKNITHNFLRKETLLWVEEQMTEWCEKYSTIHTNREEWCKKFIAAYGKLPADNKLKDIFCVPIILYICCVSEIDIEKHSSVASVYDEAFRKIAHREHQQNKTRTFNETDEEHFKIHWQYAKELAFQMFLHSRMEEELTTDAVAEAKRRTAALLGKDERDIANDCDKFFAIFHFASEQNQAVVFAHKTVWEYFTAVKLYEDYFEKMDTNDTVSVWKMIFQSFRYEKIPEDIMQYLVDLIKKKKEKQIDKWKKAFFECYYDGMLEQQLWRVIPETDDDSYSCDYLLPEQVAIAFRNLTWFLTMLDFKNDKDMEKETWNRYKFVYKTFFLWNNVNMDINCSGWENLYKISLKGAYLENAHLENAHLENAHLENAHLEGAYLMDAHLKNAHLEGAYLMDAHLNGAYLEGADLRGAHLNDADLEGAHLEGAYLTGAHLNGAHLRDTIWNSNSKLYNITIRESDLQQFDALIEKYRIQLIDPIIMMRSEGHENWIYNPETNRLEPPEQGSSH
ncbi:MAG: pentapeptide repeat-containing protein, partial [Oscillospiraceae bacterium]|nr:pentapeptide repeat-containing protein [Oscillospiraceae bacterium]